MRAVEFHVLVIQDVGADAGVDDQMREAPVHLGDGAHVRHDGPVHTPADEPFHLLQQRGDLRRLHVGVDGHAQLGSARMGDGDGLVQLLIGEFVGIAPPAPAPRPDIDGVGAVLHHRLRHLQISRRCQ